MENNKKQFNRGYIYCFSNPSMPGILKIGMTTRYINVLLSEANGANTWKPPTKYKCDIAKKVYNPRDKERILHDIFSSFSTIIEKHMLCLPIASSFSN